MTESLQNLDTTSDFWNLRLSRHLIRKTNWQKRQKKKLKDRKKIKEDKIKQNKTKKDKRDKKDKKRQKKTKKKKKKKDIQRQKYYQKRQQDKWRTYKKTERQFQFTQLRQIKKNLTENATQEQSKGEVQHWGKNSELQGGF